MEKLPAQMTVICISKPGGPEVRCPRPARCRRPGQAKS